MALDAKKVYALCKKYTDNSIAGGGAVAGKNCVITSIAPITGGNRVTFQWTLDNGTVQTDTLDVMNGINGTDGTDGVGIASIDFKEKDIDGNNVYTVTYTDSNTDEIVCPIGPQGDRGPAGVGVVAGGTTGQVLKKKSNTDFDTEWADESGGGSEHGIPSGGTTNQILHKKSNTDYDVEWTDPESSSQEQSDWNQTDNTKVDYIKNKPQNIVTDASYVHTDNNYTTTEKTKLAGLENYDDTAISGRVGDIEEVIPSDASTSNLLATVGDIPDVSGYALKSEMSITDGTGADADKTTIQLKSGLSKSVLISHQDISGKQNAITISGKKVLV